MSKDYHYLYVQLGRLLETVPDVNDRSQFRTTAGQQWLARGHALVTEVGVATGMDAIEYTTAVKNIPAGVYSNGLDQVFTILYRALAHCELKVPSVAVGSFIPVGSSFDAYAALSKIFQTATSDVLIVDPYMDETALTEFGLAVPVGVTLRLLTDEKNCKPTLRPAASKWSLQYGATRPLGVRLSPAHTLHDRAIFVDGTFAWTLTQSLKDFAKRSPAEIVKADETAKLKIVAYELLWNSAGPIT
ncbi:hypothetical protein LXA47_17690 [Massilia sp. P8910]|uniref:hypothetical protein n=1 Tax=Massilia antarctica TaxID=2765360 RepID=UPI001E41E63F|nr:hypothetical protein [Massilia antarctica]MCE3605421.1 hypothetical protein [Massilia antarctica]